MDLHHTASHAPVRDAERRSYNASDPLPGSDAWLAERKREESALEDLEAQITELWGNINSATAHFLALLAEFDRREGWAQHGVANCAHWLSWQCGIGAAAAQMFPRKLLCSQRCARRPAMFPRKHPFGA